MKTTHLTATDALREAHEYATMNTEAQLAAYLLECLGPRYASVGLGLSDARQLKAWRDGIGAPRAEVVADRLRLLTQVTRAIDRSYSPDTAAAFLRASNPDLDDRSPLLVIAKTSSPESPDVMRAVRAFLEA